MHSVNLNMDPAVLIHYYYMVASFSLMLRVFFQLFVNKENVSKTDFILCVFWPVMIWLIPINFIRDMIKITNIRENPIEDTKI